jgi:hypothetical protein
MEVRACTAPLSEPTPKRGAQFYSSLLRHDVTESDGHESSTAGLPSPTAPGLSPNQPKGTYENSDDEYYRARVSKFKIEQQQNISNWLAPAERPKTSRYPGPAITTGTFLPAEHEGSSEVRPSALVGPSNAVCAECSSADCTCSQYSYHETSPMYLSQSFSRQSLRGMLPNGTTEGKKCYRENFLET